MDWNVILPRWRMVRHTRSVSLADLKEADAP